MLSALRRALAEQLSLFGIGGAPPPAPPPQLEPVSPPPRARRSAAGRGEAFLQRLRALGLRDYDSCTLTRNRNVMVSWRGSALRVNAGYVDAPEHVQRAIVALVQGRTRASRLEAKKVVLSYRVASPDLPAVGPRRRETTHPDDERIATRLAAEHARLNAERFGGSLAPIAIRVSRRMRRRLGHYSPAGTGHPAEIAISRRHLRRDGWAEGVHTLLHEMVHQWQAEMGAELDHGPGFRMKAREVGIVPRATRRVD